MACHEQVMCGGTAGLERVLDRIGTGALAWKGFLRGCWGEFDQVLANAGAVTSARR